MQIVQRPTPHQNSRGGHLPRMIVIHGDAGQTDAGTVAWIQDPLSMVSYHYLVGRDATVYQFVDEHRRAWHAGVSAWDGYEGVNDISIGVAFCNRGDGSEPYRECQYGHGARLVADICRRHRIPCHMIRGHYEVSPGRKTDPWDWWNWPKFYELYGMWSGGRIGSHD